jgi:nanoRNase/pAp phosphatase (c-di-AMP/oligoRNAs hydrolase)
MRTVWAGKPSLLIVLQDFPDPDAIAAAASLRELAYADGIATCAIGCSGFVGRAENRALVGYLGLRLHPLAELDLSAFSVLAMVDTQPETGNNSLQAGVVPQIVIDHHPMRKATRRVDFYDIRSRYGATATILFEYLKAADLKPDIQLATALAYGIRSDTNDLGRETSDADIEAFLELYPLSNKRKLGRIETERLPRDYFAILAAALRNAATYGRCIVSALGTINNPDMIGEVADLLLRNEESAWALCHGHYQDELLVSLRTSEPGANAGKVMHRIVGRDGSGGRHNAMAGGQIPLKLRPSASMHRLERTLVRRFLRVVGESSAEGVWLVPSPGRKRGAPRIRRSRKARASWTLDAQRNESL